MNIKIPGRSPLDIEHIVLDFNGTLALNGVVGAVVMEQIEQLAKAVKIHVLTADTYGTVARQLEGRQIQLGILKGEATGDEKHQYICQLGADRCIAFGNGANDEKMLKEAALSICVMDLEGAAVRSILAADVVVPSIGAGLDLIIKTERLKAVLRG